MKVGDLVKCEEDWDAAESIGLVLEVGRPFPRAPEHVELTVLFIDGVTEQVTAEDMELISESR